MIGPPEGTLVRGARRSAEEHRLEHQLLSSAELRRRFPIFEPEAQMSGVWEPRAGILFPELAIQTHLELAEKRGAVLRFNEPVMSWEAPGEGVQVSTARGEYRAKRLLLSAGAWMSGLLSDLRLPLTVERQVLFWFAPRGRPEEFQTKRCPVHIWEYAPHQFFYGFPDLGDGVKVALHHQGAPAQPDSINREVGPGEIEAMRELLRRFLPSAEGRLQSAVVCMYTNTPDEHFILDRHPLHPEVAIASPCSGHGFKFSPVIGEIAAQMLSDRQPPFDLTLFKLKRFFP